MPNEATTRTAVVVGATGIVGRAIAAKLAELGGWRVVGVTRSGGTVPGVDEPIAVGLRDPDEAGRRLAPAADATHLSFAAYLPQASWAAEVGPNLALLVNAVEGMEVVGAPLRHVTLITGAKYYGVHLVAGGPGATVFDDDAIDRLYGASGSDWFFAKRSLMPRSPQDLDYPGMDWTVPLLQRELEGGSGLRPSYETVWRGLHRRLPGRGDDRGVRHG